jgi:hypothetical protein
VKHRVTHGLSIDDARRVVDEAFAHYRQRYAAFRPTLHWVANDVAEVAFVALGVRVEGTLHLRPGAIELEVDVPLPLRPFGARAVAAVEREVARWANATAVTGEGL